MKKNPNRVPREEWTADEKEFDRLVVLSESRDQVLRIEGRLKMEAFMKQFTREQLDAMWERIK